MPNLTFPAADLTRVQSGEKISTTRKGSTSLRRVKAGDSLTLQFGARNAPTTCRAVCSDVQRVSPQTVLDWFEGIPDTDARAHLEAEALRSALKSGSDLDRLILAAADATKMDVDELVQECLTDEDPAAPFIVIVHWKPESVALAH